jgi:hypothetical protein
LKKWFLLAEVQDFAKRKKFGTNGFSGLGLGCIRRVVAVGVVGSGLYREEFTAGSPSPASAKEPSKRKPG